VTRQAHRGALVWMRRAPGEAGEGLAHAYIEDGVLIVADGRIEAVCAYADLAPEARDGLDIVVHDDALIAPGFIDAHVHYPQLDMIGAYGAQLMEWLERYTFPAEARLADPDLARELAEAFLAELLRHGTTSALVFATSHVHSVDALFEAALKRNMRLITGKVLMDRNAPAELLDPPGGGGEASAELIERWRGRGRLGYAVTPRFAPSCSDAQLEAAGELLQAHPDVRLQTHLSENAAEIDLVARLFPDEKDYLGVYERFGLVGARSVFAHGVHLSADAFARLRKAGAAIAVCPTSNLFLGSGAFDFAGAEASGVQLALGTDVGAGVSLSVLATMGEAYKVGQMRGRALHSLQSFYMATLGGARALGIEAHVGRLEPGLEADFVVLDLAATPLLARRLAGARSVEDCLFALSIMGDDRAVRRAYVAGALAHDRDAQFRKDPRP